MNILVFITKINKYITETLTKRYWDKLYANFNQVVEVFISGVKQLQDGITILLRRIKELKRKARKTHAESKELEKNLGEFRRGVVRFLINDGYLCHYATREKQIPILDDIISKNSFMKFVAFYQRAKLYIEEAEKEYRKRSKHGDWKGASLITHAESSLKQALGCSDQLVRHWMPIIFLRHHKFVEPKSPFFEQVSAKITFIDYLRENIQAMLEVIARRDEIAREALTEGDSDNYFLKDYTEIYIDDFPDYINGFAQADLDYLRSIGLGRLYCISINSPLPKFFEQVSLGIIGLAQTILGACMALKGGGFFGGSMIQSGLQDMWATIQSVVDDSPNS